MEKPHVLESVFVAAMIQVIITAIVLGVAGCGGVGFVHPDTGVEVDAGVFGDASVEEDAGYDAGILEGPDTGTEDASIRADAGQDASYDGGSDAGYDAGYDAGIDAGSDAGSDAGQDAGYDAGNDAGSDAGYDAGHDAGPPPPYVPPRPYPRADEIAMIFGSRCLQDIRGDVWCWGRWADPLEVRLVGRIFTTQSYLMWECFAHGAVGNPMCLKDGELVRILIDAAPVLGSSWELGCSTNGWCWRDGVPFRAWYEGIQGRDYAVSYPRYPWEPVICGLFSGVGRRCQGSDGEWFTTSYRHLVWASAASRPPTVDVPWWGSAAWDRPASWQGTPLLNTTMLNATSQTVSVRYVPEDRIVWSRRYPEHSGVVNHAVMFDDERTFCLVIRPTHETRAFECWYVDADGAVSDTTPPALR
jgi:hypothetical protein